MKVEIKTLEVCFVETEVEKYQKLGFKFRQCEINKDRFWLESVGRVYIEIDKVEDLIQIASDLGEELILSGDGTVVIYNQYNYYNDYIE